jgi:CMP-N-acetylneuraminic acid synthetase
MSATAPSPLRVIALVPMRHDSERVPGKNYRPFLGEPLYRHIVRALLGCARIDQVVIDTDSPAIADDCARQFPSVLVQERPPHLRDGRIAMNDVLVHAAGRNPADVFLQTHSTNPLLRPGTIARALEEFLGALPERDSLFGVTAWRTRLYDASARPINHDPAVLLRTQDLPPVYEENSNLYIFTRRCLERHGRRIGERPMMFEIPRLEAMDIDDEDGFVLAEAVAGALASAEGRARSRAAPAALRREEARA